MPSNQNSKTPLIILAIVGGLVLVGGLILVMVLFLGGDNDSSSDDSDTDDASESADETEKKDDDKDDDEDSDADGDDTSSNTDDPTQDTPIDNGAVVAPTAEALPPGLPNLDLSQLSRIGSIEGDAEEVAAEISILVEEARVARQEFVDEFAQMNISEADIADFLQAYDLLTSESTLTSLANLTETEATVFEEKIIETVTNYLANIFGACLDDLVNADVDDLSSFDATCILEPFNQLGRDIIAILTEMGISE